MITQINLPWPDISIPTDGNTCWNAKQKKKEEEKEKKKIQGLVILILEISDKLCIISMINDIQLERACVAKILCTA